MNLNEQLNQAYNAGRRQVLAEQGDPGVNPGSGSGAGGGGRDPIGGVFGADGVVPCDIGLYQTTYIVGAGDSGIGGSAYKDPDSWYGDFDYDHYTGNYQTGGGLGYNQMHTYRLREQMGGGGGNALTTAPDTAGTAMTPTNMRSQPMDSVLQKQTTATGKMNAMTSTPRTSPEWGGSKFVDGGKYGMGPNGMETFFSAQGIPLAYYNSGAGMWVGYVLPMEVINSIAR